MFHLFVQQKFLNSQTRLKNKMHPAQEELFKFFDYMHLPTNQQNVSRPFYELAYNLAQMETTHGAELTTGMRKLLEAKDCIVRASLD